MGLVSGGQTPSGFFLRCRGIIGLEFGKLDCTPKSKKGRALLALLAAEQRPLTRVRIIDLLWSERQEDQARASLRTLLADLREQFGDKFDQLLTVDRETIALKDAVESDLFHSAPASSTFELFEGLDHIDPELDNWLRTQRSLLSQAQSARNDTSSPSASASGKWPKLALAKALVVGLALVAVTLFSFGRREAASASPQVVAVLRFTEAAGPDGDPLPDYLAQGIRDGLRASPSARVLGDKTSQKIESAGYEPYVAKQLFGAAYLVTGSIRSDVRRSHVVARLIQASTGAELWMAEYDVGAGSGSVERGEVVRDIVGRIARTLELPSRKVDLTRWTRGPEGIRLAEARRLILNNHPAQALEARAILLELVAADPNNVPALAALAEATMAASDHAYVGGTLPTSEARREARAYANRAIRLAPDYAAGYAALGASQMETADAIAPLERAVELEPGNYLYQTRLGRALEFTDRYQEAYRHQVEAVRLEPLAALPIINFIRAAYQLDRHDEIRSRLKRFAALRPEPSELAYVRAYYAFLLDDNVGCVRNFQSTGMTDIAAAQRNVLLFCLTALGEWNSALKVVADEDSLRRDVLLGDVHSIERRVTRLGRDFWSRHYESLGAAELLVNNQRSDFLLDQFDQSYNNVDEFIREGGFLTLYPQPLVVAFRRAGREKDARKLRDILYQTMVSAQRRPGGDQWESANGASVAMIDGDSQRAIALLEKCSPNCIFTVLQRDISETALFRPLVGDAKFDKIIRGYRVMINGQRRQLGLSPLPLT